MTAHLDLEERATPPSLVEPTFAERASFKEETFHSRLWLSQHETLSLERLDLLEFVDDVLAVLDDLLVEDLNPVHARVLAALAKDLAGVCDALLERLVSHRGHVEYLTVGQSVSIGLRGSWNGRTWKVIFFQCGLFTVFTMDTVSWKFPRPPKS
jgi:hypothetical protein